MDQNTLICSIIIPVYNHLDYTQKALSDLTSKIPANDKINYKIILVDDGSVDGTSDWVKAHYPAVTILNGDGNLWWSGAINLGAKYAIEIFKSDYFLLWNNDISFEDSYFERLNEILISTSPKTIIGSKIYIADKTDVIWSMGGIFNPYNGKYGMIAYFTKDSESYNKILEVDWLTGMGTVVHREVIEKIGYWDNINFPQYHGDSDYTYNAKLYGYSIKVFPALKLYNNVKNSGITHEGSLKRLFLILRDIRSKSNYKKNLIFYRRYSKSPLAYVPLIILYSKIVLGFFKWKLLNMLNIRKVS